MSQRRNLFVFAVLVGLLVSAPGCQPAATAPASKSAAVAPSDVEKLRQEAYQLQADRKWCDAEKKWQEILKHHPAGDDAQVLQDEADRNLGISQTRCTASKEPPNQPVTFERPSSKEEPPEDKIPIFYPVGKIVRSTAILDAVGDGVNQAWATKAKRHFAYRYEVLVETEVIENDKTSVVFEQRFKEVVQLRADSDLVSLELESPDSPIVKQMWRQLEDNVLNDLPSYRLGKKLFELSQLIDPNLKRTLTHFGQQIDPDGKRIAGNIDVEWAAAVDKLSGITVRIKYFSGMAITSIHQTAGTPLDKGELRKLAAKSSPFMDWFIAEVESRKIGGRFKERVSDVQSMIDLDPDATLDGELEFERIADTDDGQRQMKVVAGRVTVETSEDGKKQSAVVKPEPGGEVRYSPADHLVSRAKANWKVDTLFLTKNHLLFGTKITSDIKLTTYYEAHVVGALKP